jgi:hypothetical protein
METQTRFDLNRAVEDWRSGLRQSAACRADDLEELESHLRDAAEKLVASGLSEEEAWLVASRRIGTSQVLEQEFAKVNRSDVWLDRLLWMLVGAQAWQLITVTANALSQFTNLVALRLARGQPPYVTAIELFGMPIPPVATALFLLTNLLVLAMLVAGCWFVIRRKGSRLAALVQRPGRLGWIAGAACLGICATALLAAVGNSAILRGLIDGNTQATGRIVLASSLSGVAMSGLKTIGLALFIVLLVRRRLRQAIA